MDINIIGFENSKKKGLDKLQSFSTLTGKMLPEIFSIATEDEITFAIIKAEASIVIYSKLIVLKEQFF